MNYFLNTQTQVLLNPRLSEPLRRQLTIAAEAQNYQNHIWLMSSGTESQTRETKLVALSKDAFVHAARGVVTAFDLVAKDRCLQALPEFHVGGLSVHARSHVAGFDVIAPNFSKWNALQFYQQVQEQRITLTSLVPTQIFDLVAAELPAPASLRWVFVGGGSLSPLLWERARQLGWPVRATYGMTETCAMVAFESHAERGYERLPHVREWRVNSDGRLEIRAASLLTCYLFVDGETSRRVDPKRDGWYVSDDCGEIVEDRWHIAGRESEMVKIGGETVSLRKIQGVWDEWRQSVGWQGVAAVVAVPETRSGFELQLVVEGAPREVPLAEFNKTVLPFERLVKLHFVEAIPLSELGKVRRKELLLMISKNS